MTPRGGKRAGAGRKLAGTERGVRIMFYIPAVVVRWLRANLKPGERSGYVSRAVLAQIERESAESEKGK